MGVYSLEGCGDGDSKFVRIARQHVSIDVLLVVRQMRQC